MHCWSGARKSHLEQAAVLPISVHQRDLSFLWFLMATFCVNEGCQLIFLRSLRLGGGEGEFTGGRGLPPDQLPHAWAKGRRASLAACRGGKRVAHEPKNSSSINGIARIRPSVVR